MVIFHVRSSSHPDRYYEVTAEQREGVTTWSCGCIGFDWLSRRSERPRCRHIKVVEETLTNGVSRMWYGDDPYQPPIEPEGAPGEYGT